MEDGVEEIQNLVFTESRSLEGEKVEEAEQTGRRGEEKASRIVKNLIANLVSGNGGEEGKLDEKSSGGLAEDGGKEENQKDGIINHLISNLVSPRVSPTSKEEGDRKDEVDTEVKSEHPGTCKTSEECDGGGGIFNNLLFNVFHHDQGEQGEGRIEKEEQAEAGGGRNEDAVPATDEASILIHSIVHD